MNDYDTKLYHMVGKEQGNVSEIEVFHAKSEHNAMLIKLKKEALDYCRGASDVQLIKENRSENEVLEGPCVFSFFQETKEEMVNVQIFSLYQYGVEKSRKDLAVIRKSKWVRENDMAYIRDGNRLEHPSCEGISAVLKGESASRILLEVQEIAGMFSSGLSYAKAQNNGIGLCVLKVIDSLNVTHKIEWEHRIQLYPLEEKARLLVSSVEEKLHAQLLSGIKLRFVFY